MKIGMWMFLAIPLLAGCSSFNREWKAALRQPIPAEGLAGPWEGHWISDANGHNDRLQCVITEESTNRYKADFHATYKKVLHFGYSVPLAVRQNGSTFEFSGQADLGKLAGGLYTYEGSATGTNFFFEVQLEVRSWHVSDGQTRCEMSYPGSGDFVEPAIFLNPRMLLIAPPSNPQLFG